MANGKTPNKHIKYAPFGRRTSQPLGRLCESLRVFGTKMKEGDLENSLLETIKGEGGKDLALEAAEFSLDSVLKDGVLKDFPVIGTVAKLYSTAVGVQGYIFAKKIRKFVSQLSTISLEDRKSFVARLESDPKHREKTIDTLLSFLDKLDDMEKAPLLANAFSGYIRDELDFNTLQRLASAIDRCMVWDLKYLEKLSKPLALDSYIGDVLVSAGLASIDAIPTIKGPEAKSTYIISHLGELFLQVVVKGLSRDDQ